MRFFYYLIPAFQTLIHVNFLCFSIPLFYHHIPFLFLYFLPFLHFLFLCPDPPYIQGSRYVLHDDIHRAWLVALVMESRDGEAVQDCEMHAQIVHPVVFGCLCCWPGTRCDLVWLHAWIRVLSVWHMGPCAMPESSHSVWREKWKLKRWSRAGWRRAD